MVTHLTRKVLEDLNLCLVLVWIQLQLLEFEGMLRNTIS